MKKQKNFTISHFLFFLLRLIIVKNIFLLEELMKKNRKNIFFDKNKNIFFIKFLWFYFFRNFGFFMKNQFFEKKMKKWKIWKKIHFFHKNPVFLRKIMVVEEEHTFFRHAKAWWAFSVQKRTCKSIVKKSFF